MTTLVFNKSKSNVRKATMTHHDGTQRIVTVTNKETPFPKGHLLISHSDLSGNITYVNRWLIHLSGYKEAELLGKPHYILRHPDMPAAVFKEMWTTIREGHIWQGPLKNLRKDSGFFWADVTVTPSTRKGQPIGYVSVYHELDRHEIEEYEERYTEEVE